MRSKIVKRLVPSMLFPMILLLMLMSGPLCFGAGGGDCPKTVKVLVRQVETGQFTDYKDIEGSIVAASSRHFRSNVPGVVKSIEVAVGVRVRAGDVLVRMDENAIKREMAEAATNLAIWKKKLFQRRNWKHRKPDAEKQAESNVKKYSEMVVAKRALLSQVEIKAPVDGHLESINIREGDFISQGFVLGTIVDAARVKVALDSYSGVVETGQPVKVTVKEISRVVDGTVQKGTDGSAALVIDNPQYVIKNGMKALFSLAIKTYTDARLVPGRSLLKDDQGDYLYVVDGKRARKTYLTIGAVEGDTVMVSDGLNAGDEIIASEVAPTKRPTLKETLECVRDHAKIKIVVLDAEKGKFVKRGKKHRASRQGDMKTAPVVVVKKKEKKGDTGRDLGRDNNVDRFIDYLINNKDSLGYKKFNIRRGKKQKTVEVYCSAAVKDKLLPVIRKLDVENNCMIKVVGAERKESNRSRSYFFAPSLRFGISAGGFLLFDENFKEVYGSTMMGFGIDLAYSFARRMDIWLYAGTFSRTTAVNWSLEDLQFKLKPITASLRYFLVRSNKFDLFVGGGANYYRFRDVNPIVEVKDSAIGFHGLGGMYYHLKRNLALQLAVRYNNVSKIIDGADNNLDLGSMELLLGFSFSQ